MSAPTQDSNNDAHKIPMITLNEPANNHIGGSSEEKRESKKRRNIPLNMWLFLGVILMTGAIIGLIVLLIIWFNFKSVITSYGIVIDAGSTSSKIHLYSWNDTKDRPNAAVVELVSKVTDNAITESRYNPSQVGEEIQRIINKSIIAKIPRSDVSRTPIYLGATAGMRKLSFIDPNATLALLKSVRESMSVYGFSIDDPGRQFRIISGAEEGIYGWITINYLLHKLGRFQGSTFKLASSHSLSEPVGALDLGGSSTQITFVHPPSRWQIPEREVTSVSLFKRKFNVYSYSFLCYGKSAAEFRFYALLFKKSNFTTSVINPCQPRGTSQSFPVSQVFSQPCVSGIHALNTYGYEVTPPKGKYKNDTILKILGSSDPQTCKDIVLLLFNKTVRCPHYRCSFNSVYQPEIRGKFVAMSAFYYVLSFYNITANPKFRNGRTASKQEFLQAIFEYCGKSWDEARHYPVYKEEFLKVYCFDGLYINALLENYGFNDTNWGSLTFERKINNMKVSWALGFMISQTHQLPPARPYGFDFVTLVAFLILFGCLFLCGLVFLVIAFRSKPSHHVVYDSEEPSTKQDNGQEATGTYGAL